MAHRNQTAYPIRNAIIALCVLVLVNLAANAQAQGSDEFVSCGGFIKPSSAVQKYVCIFHEPQIFPVALRRVIQARAPLNSDVITHIFPSNF